MVTRTQSTNSPAEGAPRRVTELLQESARGSEAAFDALIPLVYDELRAIAHRRLRQERPDHTLDTTAVVHEAYLKLAERRGADWEDRNHFFAVAARIIRHVLIDYARQHGAAKRGGGLARVQLREGLAGHGTRSIELIALDQALSRLAEKDERLERVVECRFYAGMTMGETAEALGRPLRSVERDWQRAKAYLYQALSDDEGEGG